MRVKATEIDHQNNAPITNYDPLTLGSVVEGAYLFNNGNSYPLVSGGGLAIEFVSEDSDNNGYVRITNTQALLNQADLVLLQLDSRSTTRHLRPLKDWHSALAFRPLISTTSLRLRVLDLLRLSL